MVSPRRAGVDRQKRMWVEGIRHRKGIACFVHSEQASRAPFSAVPVYSRRFFSQNLIFDKANARIEKASDLVGKRIVIWAFQGTMLVFAKGDLQGEYGVPWRKVKWFTERLKQISWSRRLRRCITYRRGERVQTADLRL